MEESALWWYNLTAMKNHITKVYSTPTQLKLPVDLERIIKIAVFELRQEYAIEYVEYILNTFLEAVGMTTEDFVHGKGKRKTSQQRLYEKLYDCYKKLAAQKAA